MHLATARNQTYNGSSYRQTTYVPVDVSHAIVGSWPKSAPDLVQGEAGLECFITKFNNLPNDLNNVTSVGLFLPEFVPKSTSPSSASISACNINIMAIYTTSYHAFWSHYKYSI